MKDYYAVCAHIDLNPVAAGITAVPEESNHTSVKVRVDHVKKQGRVKDLQAAIVGSVAGSRASKELEEALWLIPIEDRRQLDSHREGMLSGFTLGNHLMLVEFTGRLLREGKAAISTELADIFERLGRSAALWQARLQKLSGGRSIGRFLCKRTEPSHAGEGGAGDYLSRRRGRCAVGLARLCRGALLHDMYGQLLDG